MMMTLDMTTRPVSSIIAILAVLACFSCVPAGAKYEDREEEPVPTVRLDGGVLQPDHQDSGTTVASDAGRPVDSEDAGSSGAPDAEEMTDPNAISFQRDVLPLMETYCAECHHPGRQPDLSAMPLDRAAREVLAERIIARGETNMPPAPRDQLTTSELDLIRRWKNEGANP